tara:strand:- start:415 stop:570 length:156 start_codon:yes stop_codon:yes gene_type:complete
MIRTIEGNLIKFKKKDYNTDKQYYINLWKKKYNVVLKSEKITMKICSALKK